MQPFASETSRPAPPVRWRNYTGALVAVSVVAVALRVWLALVNLEANDDHMRVVRLIRETGYLPLKPACDECFQPKLFHAVSAALLTVAHVPAGSAEIKIVQTLNAVVGCMILVFTWRFLRENPFTERAKLVAFALLALNPKLVAINAQATNDTFVILFGVAAFYYSYRFSRSPGFKGFAAMTLATVLGIVSKTNGLVTFGSIGLALAVRAVRTRRHSRALRGYAVAFILLVPILTIANPLSQYLSNWRYYGTPITLNIDPQPPPHWFEETPAWWPGVTSVSQSFLTFRFISMLAEPYDTYPPGEPPLHRTSFWSQLYGRAHFAQFDQWPPSWRTQRPGVLFVGRAILLLALLPTALLLTGIIVESVRIVSRLVSGDEPTEALLFTLPFFTFLAFAMAYAYRYRAFTVMKAIFLYPALLTFAYHFAVGFDWAFSNDRQGSGGWPRTLATNTLALLLVLYAASVADLIRQLAA